MPIFNVVAAYEDTHGGVYEWEGEAADYDDAIRRAQEQAWADNCPTAVAEGEDPFDMLNEEGISVIDVSARHALKAELLAALRNSATTHERELGDAVAAEHLRGLADRFESTGTHT